MGDVQILTPSGNRGTVPEDQLADAVARGAKPLGAGEAAAADQKAAYGGMGGALIAEALGAADVASGGGGTALALQAGKTFGGAAGQNKVAEALHGAVEEHPVEHFAGQLVPSLIAPEGGEATLAEILPQGAGLAARATRFALPKLATGTAEMAQFEHADAVSEGLLNHDMSAEAYWAHAKPANMILGGVLNVGIGAGFKGLGKLGEGVFAKEFGRVGEASIADSKAIDKAIEAGQKAGVTSDVTEDTLRQLAGLARSGDMYSDKVAEGIIKKAGTPEEQRGAAMYFKSLKDSAASEARVMAQHGTDMKRGVDALFDLDKSMDGAQFTMKTPEVRGMVDAGRIRAQADALIKAADRVEATLLPPELPPPPKPPKMPSLEEVEARIAKEIRGERRAGTAVQDFAKRLARGEKLETPEQLQFYQNNAKAIENELRRMSSPDTGALAPDDAMLIKRRAEAAHAFETHALAEEHAKALAEHEAAVSRIVSEHEKAADPIARMKFGDGPLVHRLAMSRGEVMDIVSRVSALRRNVKLGVAQGGQDGAAKLFTTIDDIKKIVGSMAGYGTRSTGAELGEQVADHFYQTLIKPLGEDASIWGERLATFQQESNAAYHGSVDAMKKLKSALGYVEGTDGMGRPIWRADPMKVARYLREMGTPQAQTMGNLTDMALQKALDAVPLRARVLRTHMTELPEAHRGAFAVAGKMSDELRAIVERGVNDSKAWNAVKEMRDRATRSGARGIVGKLLDYGTNPTRALEQVAQFRRVEKAIRDRLGKSAESVVKGEKADVVPGISSEADKKIALQVISDVKKYSAEPASLGGTLKRVLGDIANVSPEVTSSIAAIAARAILYLASRIPEPLPARITDKGSEPRYAPSDLDRVWKDYQLVSDPTLLMKKVQTGQVHHDDIVLMQSVFPNLYEQMRQLTLQQIMKAKELGGLQKMPYQQQLSLAWLIGAPLDETQKPDFTLAMQQSAAQDPNNQGDIGRSAQGGGRPRNVKIDLERYKTLTEQMGQ